MGKSAPSAPAAPDPAKTAAAQGAVNKETAITQAALNRINQYTPYGSVVYTQRPGNKREVFDQAGYNKAVEAARQRQYPQPSSPSVNTNNYKNQQNQPWNNGGGAPDFQSPQLYSSAGYAMPRREDYISYVDDEVPQYEQTVTLSPEQQRLYDLQFGAQERLGNTANQQLDMLQKSLSKPINYDGLPEQIYQIGDYASDRNKVEDALFQRLNPQLERDQAAMEQRLASQGINMGSQAYNSAQGQFGKQANDARYGAILNAGSEQSRLFQQAMAQAALQNQARQQGIQERTALRTQPLNEITALMSGSQVQNPQFSQVPQVGIQPADYQGAANLQYQGQLAQYNAANQQNQAMMGGLFGLGSAGIGAAVPFMFSDIRLKRDIIKTGKWRGFNKYLFRYLWSDAVYEGVMAQEVEQTRPDAVVEIGGFKAVNYSVL